MSDFFEHYPKSVRYWVPHPQDHPYSQVIYPHTKGVTFMSTPQPPKPNATIEGHPDDLQNVLAGIFAGIQGFIAVEPYVLQIINAINGRSMTVTVHPTAQQ